MVALLSIIHVSLQVELCCIATPGSVRKKTKQRCERCVVMLPAPFAERGARWVGGSPCFSLLPPYHSGLTSGSLFCFCLSGRMTRARLESTAVISPLLPVTFYSFPSSRPSRLEETDTARRWGSRGGEGVKIFTL